jgi:hypothetical protein
VSDPAEPELALRRIARLWMPLAGSWLLMAAELPLFAACVARMPDPKVNLAAYGALVFPIALVIEAPIMMLLSAATALAVDSEAWRRLRRYMHEAGLVLTVLHALIAFTPLLDLIAAHVFHVPPEIVAPARTGLALLLPWTWAIAYRRLHQGVLIRNERGRPVVVGTFLRLAGNAVVYVVGFALLRNGVQVSGIAIGSSAVACGVVLEATFIGWCTQRLLCERKLPEPVAGEVLTRPAFLRFYVPLALTPLIALLTQPIGVAAMGHMPDHFDSLAAWAALHGFFFVVRTGGFAYNEVVLSLLGRPGAERALRRFGLLVGGGSAAFVLVFTSTPLARAWFEGVIGLPQELALLAAGASAFGIVWPLSQAFQGLYQGTLVHRRRTRAVTEAILVFFVVVTALFALGAAVWTGAGARYAVLALTTASLAQTGWLALRVRATGR